MALFPDHTFLTKPYGKWSGPRPVHSGLMNHNAPEARCHTEVPGTEQVLSNVTSPSPGKR